MRIPEGKEREKGTEEIIEVILTNFPKSVLGQEATDPGSSENTKQGICSKNYT